MTRIWKQSISLLLAMVMVLGILPVNALAQENEDPTAEVVTAAEPIRTEDAEASDTESTEQSPQETDPAVAEISAAETASDEETVEAVEETMEAVEETVDSVEETTAVVEETVESIEETTEVVEETTEQEKEATPVTDSADAVEANTPGQDQETVEPEIITEILTAVATESDLPSDEELFAAYLEHQFLGGGSASFGTAARDRLGGDIRLAYDALVPIIREIASGERASAVITMGAYLGEAYDPEVEVKFSRSSFSKEALHVLLQSLLEDMPYELYWFDKVTGISVSSVYSSTYGLFLTFYLSVSGSYHNGATVKVGDSNRYCTANAAKTGAASAAAWKARAVVDQIAANPNIKTDYEKLIAYKDWICDAVSYDSNAAFSGNLSSNSDPWQVISVFDGNPGTNVVCEGYSKAFQYLCDLSDFEGDITCYTVTGRLGAMGTSGAHMWNIVDMDGAHYLVDVTNSDVNTIGDDGSLFLVGTAPNPDGSYTFGGVSFTYDDNTKSLWESDDILALADTKYTPPQEWPDEEEDASAYLSFRWLNYDEEAGGFCENSDGGDVRGMDMPVGDDHSIIFYANVWDSTNGKWISTPVPVDQLVTEFGYIHLEPIGEQFPIAAGQPNGDCFVYMTTADTWDVVDYVCYTTGGETLKLPIEIRRGACGLYSSEELSNETWLRFADVNPGKTNVYYMGYDNGGDTIVAGSVKVTENADMLVGGTMEATSKPNVYKITLTEEAAKIVTWEGGFNIGVEFQVRQTDGSTHQEFFFIWCRPYDMGPSDASFEVNGLWYHYFRDLDGFVTYDMPEAQGPVAVDLPENVTYDYATNTLTLRGATLESLGFYYSWKDDMGNSNTNLPSQTVNLVLIGKNTIVNTVDRALTVADNANLVISGSGSLNIRSVNSEDNRTEDGERYAFPAVSLWNNANLTIAGSAQVTMELAGVGHYGNEVTNLFVMEGDWEGSSILTVRDSATLTTRIPEGARHDIDYGNNGDSSVLYNGIVNFAQINVQDSATLNTCELQAYDSDRPFALNQTGGTINITSAGNVFRTDEGQPHYHYRGIYISQRGSVNISGGNLNIRAVPTAQESASSSYFCGIESYGGTINLTGGTVSVTGAYDGEAIKAGTDDWNGEVVGSTLNFKGGNLYYNNIAAEDVYSGIIFVESNSTANFTGGSIRAEHTALMLDGTVTWEGTTLTGNEAGMMVGGKFTMNSGKIQLQNCSVINFYGMAELNGGTIDMDNSIMFAQCGTSVQGNTVIDIDFDTYITPELNFALAIESYLAVSENAKITIDIAKAVTDEGQFNSILNNGTFHQMGGTVTVKQSKYIAMLTHGATLVNNGTLNLTGDIGYVQGYDFDRPEEQPSQFFINGGTVNATGNTIGILLNGPAEWVDGSVNAKATGMSNGSILPQAVRVEKFTGDMDGSGNNISSLTISGGSHTLTAMDTSNAADYSKGLAVVKAPVAIVGGEITIDAEMAIYSISDSLSDTNITSKLDFLSLGTRKRLSLTSQELAEGGEEGAFFHTLKEENGSYAGKVKISLVPVIPVPAKPYQITNVVSGVHVYWKAVEGAEKYGLWRSETGKDGTYKWIANPTVPHFTDTKVESGKTYYYRVTSLSAEGEHSEKSEAIGIAYVSTPDIKTRTNVAAGVKLEWNKVSGATGYAIYRKSYSGNDAWVRVGTVSGNSTDTWTDSSVKNNNGEAYRYTIRALAGSDMKTLSGCRNTGRTMVRLSSQVLKSVAKASATSAKATWTTSSRVTGYEVRFMVGDTVYKTFTVGNWKTGVKTFTGLKRGQTYTVQVRTYKKVDGVGSFYSDWSAAKTVTLK